MVPHEKKSQQAQRVVHPRPTLYDNVRMGRNDVMYQDVIDGRSIVVIDSMLGVLWTLAGGLGSVCWEVASFWVKVKLLPWPLAESTL